MEQTIEMPMEEYLKIIEKCNRLEMGCALVVCLMFITLALAICIPIVCFFISEYINKEF